MSGGSIGVPFSILKISCKDFFTVARDKCHPNPCHHDGKCETEGLDYVCSCSGGWSGDTCEGKADLDLCYDHI